MPGKARRMASATSGIAPPALGVMIRDSHGASSAACWTYNYSGGMREAQASLPDAAWLTNLPYSEARTLDLETQGGPVRADGWIGADWRKICAEWDLTDSSAIENAEILSRLATRVVSIAQEALAASEAARNPSFRENLRNLPRRPSLATGIRRAFGPRIRGTAPKEQLAADAARSLHQSGIRVQTRASAASRPTVSFHAHFPRFEFAEALASEPVPQPGPWQAVKLASPGSPLSEDALDALARLGRPVFAAGEFHPNSDSAPPWHRPPAPGGGKPRSAFTLEEIRILIRRGEFRIREAFAGPAWSANGSLLGECIRLLAAACGGRLTARTSWSAGTRRGKPGPCGLRPAARRPERLPDGIGLGRGAGTDRDVRRDRSRGTRRRTRNRRFLRDARHPGAGRARLPVGHRGGALQRRRPSPGRRGEGAPPLGRDASGRAGIQRHGRSAARRGLCRLGRARASLAARRGARRSGPAAPGRYLGRHGRIARGRSMSLLESASRHLADLIGGAPSGSLMDRIRLEAAEDASALSMKDGTLVSFICLEGSMRPVDGEALSRAASRLRVSLAPFLSTVGHAVEISFCRDPIAAGRLVDQAVQVDIGRARKLGLDLEDVIAERRAHLPSLLVEESCLIAVYTRHDPVSDGSGSKGGPSDPGRAPQARGGQASGRTPDGMFARHATLVEALCRDLRALGQCARGLGAAEALQDVRAALYPLTAPWKRAWLPVLPAAVQESGGAIPPPRSGFRAMPGTALEMSGGDFSNASWPSLDRQLATEGAFAADSRTVRIGDAIFAGFDMTVAPEVLTPFNALVDSVTAAPAPFPWRCSFLIEPGGLQAVRLKEQYARLFAFSAPTRNRRIRDAIDELREIDGSEDTVARLRICFATWARIGDAAALRRNAAILRRSVERWGNSVADGVSGDILATVLGSVPGIALESTAPPAAAPLASALAMAPLGRPAGPWSEGSILLRSDDGKIWPYQPGSLGQNSWTEIYTGASGSGKSVAMNAFNLAAALAPHAGAGSELPRIAVLDIGSSSKGLVSLVKESLPPERWHEAVHLKLRMSARHAVNVFDTPLGMRKPLPRHRAFLVNFLSVLCDLAGAGGSGPLPGLIGASVDQAFETASDSGNPRRYLAGDEPLADSALADLGFAADGFASWWDAADALFQGGRLEEVRSAVHSGALPEAYAPHHMLRAEEAKQVPKLLCIDEFHRAGQVPGFRLQVLQDIREGRKRNLRVSLASQLPEDFDGPIMEMASGLFMFSAPPAPYIRKLADSAGLEKREESILRNELTGPGPDGAPMFCAFRHKDGDCRQKLVLTIGPSELWALSTTAEDVALRDLLYEALGAPEARAVLAARFPGGSAKAEIETRLRRQIESGTPFGVAGIRDDVARRLADELIALSAARRRADRPRIEDAHT